MKIVTKVICKLDGCDVLFEKIVHNKIYCCLDHKKIGSTKEYREKNTEKNREKNRSYQREYYPKYVEKNKDSIRTYQREFQRNNTDYKNKYRVENRERIKDKKREYYIKNKVDINKKNLENQKKRLKTDVLYKLTCNIRCSIKNSFLKNGHNKKSKTIDILGCSFKDFKIYLESKFEPWMTWENRGLYNSDLNYGWDIDHIIPISSAKTYEEIIRLNHYSNLQPLCGYINRVVKKDKNNPII